MRELAIEGVIVGSFGFELSPRESQFLSFAFLVKIRFYRPTTMTVKEPGSRLGEGEGRQQWVLERGRIPLRRGRCGRRLSRRPWCGPGAR